MKQPWLIDGKALEEWVKVGIEKMEQLLDSPRADAYGKVLLQLQSGRFNVKEPEKRKCVACNGTGIYDSHGSPTCGGCDGTGFES